MSKYKNENGVWCRMCKQCNTEITYSCVQSAGRADKVDAVCVDCRMKGLRSHITEETKMKISKTLTGRKQPLDVIEKRRQQLIGQTRTKEQRQRISQSLIGRKLSPEHIEKSAAGHRGKPLSDAHKKAVSESLMGHRGNKGYKHSEEFRKKQRIIAAKRILKNGHIIGVDDGAKEWFDMMNANGYNFIHPNFFLSALGYFLDGYDEQRHIIMEYDSPKHRYPSQKSKDLQRQSEIIKYFEDIGKPLNQFVRVDATRPDRLGIEIVYRGNQ